MVIYSLNLGLHPLQDVKISFDIEPPKSLERGRRTTMCSEMDSKDVMQRRSVGVRWVLRCRGGVIFPVRIDAEAVQQSCLVSMNRSGIDGVVERAKLSDSKYSCKTVE